MRDGALALLMEQLGQSGKSTLWLVDEHLATRELPRAHGHITCLTNRFDTAEILRRQSYPVVLSDFDFSPLSAAAFEAVFYRVSKEKPVVHHLINEALRRLPVGGQLLLSGYKGDGLRTYVDKAAALVDGDCSSTKGSGGARVVRIVKSREPDGRLDDGDYRRLRNIAPADHPALFSKPGIFGWKKIDKGSVALIDCLPGFLSGFSAPPKTVTDLGCGYGYLTVMANRLLPAYFVATDNNAAAVTACRQNLAEHGIDGRVALADCGAGIEQQADAVLCNPPFHRGFGINSNLTDRFLNAGRQLLKPGGQALYVVNQFIPLERKAADFFGTVDEMAVGGGFKVLRLKN